MKRRRIITAVALVLAACALAVAASVRLRASRPEARTLSAFTVRFIKTVYPKDAAPVTTKQIHRRWSDGSWRAVITDGRQILRDRAFINGRGFLLVDYANKTLWRDAEILANVPSVTPVNTEQFTKSEFYAGADTIFGRTAYHMTYKNTDGAVTEEFWIIPELGAIHVKSVVYRAPGVLASVEDAVSLEVGEPDRSLLKLPDFPEAERAKNKK